MFRGTNGGHIVSEAVRVGIWQGKNEGRERMGPEIVGTWQEREFSWVNEWEGFVSYKTLGKKSWLYGKSWSLVGQIRKEGYGFIWMRAETVGIWKERVSLHGYIIWEIVWSPNI